MKALACLFLSLMAALGVAKGQEKPNILWITIEDTSPQFIGCYGNKDASTPAIDRLAKEGVRFTSAFSTGTVCSPSRSTIITGVPTYKLGTGNHRSQYPVPGFVKGFPYYLKAQGYYVTNNAKTDYNLANEKAFIREAWHESSRKAGWHGRKPGQPFFAVYNFAESHQSRTMSMPYDWYVKHVWDHLPAKDRIGDGAFAMPPFFQDSPVMRKQFARVYNALKLTDNRIDTLLRKLENDGLRENTIVFLFADHGEGIPRGKTNGIGLGYRVPFVVWVPKKYRHLSPWRNGTVADELVSFEDLAPTLISLGGGRVPAHMQGRVLMGKNRSKPPKYLVLSADRADNGPDMVRTVTDGRWVYARNFMPFIPEIRHIRYMEMGEISQHMRQALAAGQLNALQSSLFEPRLPACLYDLKSDPWETKNRVVAPQHQEVVAQMRERLERGMLESRDIHLLPEYEISQLSLKTTPYEYRLDSQAFPVAKVYAAAALSGKTGDETATRQAALLADGHKLVRYWAITGLCSHGPGTLQKHASAILAAKNDPYPPVAIRAAALAYQHLNDKNATAQLKQFCQNSHPALALMAINHLLYVDQKQPFLATVAAVREAPGSVYRVKAACAEFLGMQGLLPKSQPQ